MPLQVRRENPLHQPRAFLLAHAVEAGAGEGFGIGLEDPCRAAGFVLIGVGDEAAPFGLKKDESERVERAGGAHPGELVRPQVYLGSEMIGVMLAEAAVAAVGNDDQVGVRKVGRLVDLGLELQLDAELRSPLLQKQQQRPSRAPAEAVATDAVHAVLEVDRDVVPIGEVANDVLIALRIVFCEIVEGFVGKHHAEAEGVVGTIALEHGDLRVRTLLLEQDREVEARRPAADDRDLHATLRHGFNHMAPIILSLKYLARLGKIL